MITAISGSRLAVSGVTSPATLNAVAPSYTSRNASAWGVACLVSYGRAAQTYGVTLKVGLR